MVWLYPYIGMLFNNIEKLACLTRLTGKQNYLQAWHSIAAVLYKN